MLVYLNEGYYCIDLTVETFADIYLRFFLLMNSFLTELLTFCICEYQDWLIQVISCSE